MRNLLKKKECNKRYREKNRDKIREASREYYYKNKDRIREYNEKHKEDKKKYMLKWRKNNPDIPQQSADQRL